MTARYLCRNCRFLGRPAKSLRGSPALELVLWLCFVVPGAVYAWWRSRGGVLLCRRCGSARVVEDFSAEASAIVGEQPELPEQALSRAAVFWRTFSAVPLAAGVGFVALFALSALVPAVRDTAWFEWLFILVVAPIIGHNLWTLVHISRWVARKFRQRV